MFQKSCRSFQGAVLKSADLEESLSGTSSRLARPGVGHPLVNIERTASDKEWSNVGKVVAILKEHCGDLKRILDVC